jgi:heat shock protein HtpX
MDASPRTSPSSFLQRWSDQEAQRLKQEFLEHPHPNPDSRHSWRSAAALGLATLVLLGYLLTCLMGLWLAWAAVRASHTNVLQAFGWGLLSLICLTFGWLARPRPNRGSGTIVTAQQAPELYALTSEVAALLHAPMPRVLRLDGQVNASVMREGFPPRFSLTLGLPLMFALHPQERLAVLAHELAHEVNGDPGRGQWIWAAMRVLFTLEIALAPEEWSQVGATGLIVNALRWLLVWPVHGLLWTFNALLGEASQRAEFRADLMAAAVSGSAAAVSGLDKLHFAELLELALQKQRSNPERPHAFLELRYTWDHLNPQQQARQREQTSLERLRLDSSHPPTADHIEVLSRHALPGVLTLTEERAHLIETELTPFVRSIETEAYELYRERYS